MTIPPTTTATPVTVPSYPTPITDNMKLEIQKAGRGDDRVLEAMLAIMRELEKDRGKANESVTTITQRVDTLIARIPFGATIHTCDNCCVSRALCCLGISRCPTAI